MGFTDKNFGHEYGEILEDSKFAPSLEEAWKPDDPQTYSSALKAFEDRPQGILDSLDNDFESFLRETGYDETMENWSPGPPTNSVPPSSRPTGPDTEPTPNIPISSPGSQLQEHRTQISHWVPTANSLETRAGPLSSVINHGSSTDTNINYQNSSTEIQTNGALKDDQRQLMLLEQQRIWMEAAGKKKTIEEEARKTEQKMDVGKQIDPKQVMASASSNADSIPLAGNSAGLQNTQEMIMDWKLPRDGEIPQIEVTPDDIRKVRNQPRVQNIPDNMIPKLTLRLKTDAWVRNWWKTHLQGSSNTAVLGVNTSAPNPGLAAPVRAEEETSAWSR
ncbi:hypothetical protein QBC37DRAFT_86605 [Rhypophila decipiens]|uniref:Uncharacterized protein n=1 Tax=Rhypophila decipiens TaxID=261697 RepID=A0AAN6Y095_9PEZI|nr:hypothetical protein QBC37DRAFT_86605 [Rhypophila decipiens]